MIYVLYGTNTDSGRSKLHALLKALQAKRPDAALFRVTPEETTPVGLKELASARGLFEPKHIVLLDRVLSTAPSKEVVLSVLPDLKASENLFVLFERELDAKTLTALKRYAEKIQLHSADKEKKEEYFNRFALTDALGKRDRKRLWVLYRTALQKGLAEEEIHGLLFWQVKSMLLAQGAAGAAASGLKPFVFSKAKSSAQNFKSGELQKLSRDLVLIYHDARRGRSDMETALERFVLSI